MFGYFLSNLFLFKLKITIIFIENVFENTENVFDFRKLF
ncbi:hypothetical protein RCH33_2359 [Flavobacterium daejeonense]|nr:hypothetical protein RCH33_2359 [Flavobacterium daejeonense]